MKGAFKDAIKSAIKDTIREANSLYVYSTTLEWSILYFTMAIHRGIPTWPRLYLIFLKFGIKSTMFK